MTTRPSSTSGESVFTYAAPGLKFGRGASSEIGWDVQQLVSDREGGARRVASSS